MKRRTATPTRNSPSTATSRPRQRSPITYVAPENIDIFKAAFAAARHPNYTIILYPELGHGLGWTPSRYADTIEDIDPEPLDDLIDWLDTTIRRR
jgi:pimeloyl-ACP methyl ester carboxylesterase